MCCIDCIEVPHLAAVLQHEDVLELEHVLDLVRYRLNCIYILRWAFEWRTRIEMVTTSRKCIGSYVILAHHIFDSVLELEKRLQLALLPSG